MNSFKLVSNYRNNIELRESFNNLAQKTFEIDFSSWYEKGYWKDDYIPYSFMDNEKIIANASIFKMNVIINNITYHAIQIGTVMTDEKHRNQGLAKELILHILNLYKEDCDFMYLFANETVLDFYPKFGFTRLNESEYSLTIDQLNLSDIYHTKPIKLSMNEHQMLLEDFASNRSINSERLDVINNKNLLMFYFTIVFSEAIYYIEELETVVLMEYEEETLHIFDIISRQKHEIETILTSILIDNTKKVVFHYTPEYTINGIEVETISNDDDALFILSDTTFPIDQFKFPITSHC